jgi:hypothetical protein
MHFDWIAMAACAVVMLSALAFPKGRRSDAKGARAATRLAGEWERVRSSPS